jgi:hypothetical protein
MPTTRQTHAVTQTADPVVARLSAVCQRPGPLADAGRASHAEAGSVRLGWMAPTGGSARGYEVRLPLVVSAGVALVGAAILATAPRGLVERVVPVAAADDAARIDASIVVDADRGEIRSDGGRLASFVRAEPVEMALRGTTGDGPVAVTVWSPSGEPIIREVVGASTWFDLSAPIVTGVDVELTATPTVVPAPGGEVLVRLDLTVRAPDQRRLQLIAADVMIPWAAGPFGPEHEALGTIEQLSRFGPAGPDGCGEVLADLPVPLRHGRPISCSFVVPVEGRAGDVVTGQVELVVAADGEEATLPGAEVTITMTDPASTRDGGPAGRDASAPDEATGSTPDPGRSAPPLHGVIPAGRGGAYPIEVVADRGSPGFQLALEWWEPSPSVGIALAAVWLLAGLVGMTVGLAPDVPDRGLTPGSPGRPPAPLARLAGAALGFAGLAVVVTLWATAEHSGALIVGGTHDWYWTRWFVVLCAATLALTLVGTVLASPGSPRPGARLIGGWCLGLGIAVAILAVLAGIGGYAYGTEGASSSYAGDYLFLAVHLQALVIGGVLLGIGGALRGTRRAGAGPDRTPAPRQPATRSGSAPESDATGTFSPAAAGRRPPTLGDGRTRCHGHRPR